ncbi:hypothetical protein N473_08630 [Pseudoalteromonas luteoviolacea CPMOR-1]|uniref:Uncharacterized protein n=1 Tax=Pseudoalteromonas luteoviolacea CPMOR-1 TaxID=1365248 RepID=A0A167MI25_9GAMM|nr:DUF6326 family protein [Pseudoalteromonas luteoviolacea]KZN66446.1 hypothetical protein N473_08630 [Pseudoalteromonas luteoviolacea CPMOR-1]
MSELSEYQVNIKIKLCALWSAVMSLYIYCDYFELYTPTKIESMINGTTIFGAGDQTVLLGLSSIMLVTSLMICLSVLLPAKINRILNIMVGLIMTVMLMFLAYAVGWYFYKMYAVVESILTMVIVWLAWKWPEEPKV